MGDKFEEVAYRRGCAGPHLPSDFAPGRSSRTRMGTLDARLAKLRDRALDAPAPAKAGSRTPERDNRNELQS